MDELHTNKLNFMFIATLYLFLLFPAESYSQSITLIQYTGNSSCSNGIVAERDRLIFYSTINLNTTRNTNAHINYCIQRNGTSKFDIFCSVSIPNDCQDINGNYCRCKTSSLSGIYNVTINASAHIINSQAFFRGDLIYKKMSISSEIHRFPLIYDLSKSNLVNFYIDDKIVNVANCKVTTNESRVILIAKCLDTCPSPCRLEFIDTESNVTLKDGPDLISFTFDITKNKKILLNYYICETFNSVVCTIQKDSSKSSLVNFYIDDKIVDVSNCKVTTNKSSIALAAQCLETCPSHCDLKLIGTDLNGTINRGLHFINLTTEISKQRKILIGLHVCQIDKTFECTIDKENIIQTEEASSLGLLEITIMIIIIVVVVAATFIVTAVICRKKILPSKNNRSEGTPEETQELLAMKSQNDQGNYSVQIRGIPLEEFIKEHLPTDYQIEELYVYIQTASKLTAKLIFPKNGASKSPTDGLEYLSRNKNNKECISGMVTRIEIFEKGHNIYRPIWDSSRDCSCHKCIEGSVQSPNWVEIEMSTVAPNDSEECEIYLEQFNLKIKHIFRTDDWSENTLKLVSCDQTILNKAKILKESLDSLRYWNDKLNETILKMKTDLKQIYVSVSHPHGHQRHVFIGEWKTDNSVFMYTPDIHLSISGGPVILIGYCDPKHENYFQTVKDGARINLSRAPIILKHL